MNVIYSSSFKLKAFTANNNQTMHYLEKTQTLSNGTTISLK